MINPDAGYSAVHKWMAVHFPKTGRCEMCGASGRMTHYARKSSGLSRDRADWLELCVPCHRKFDGVTGATLSAERRAKISAGQKGRVHSPETRAKMSAAQKGRPKSAETRARMSAAAKARAETPEGKAHLIAAAKASHQRSVSGD